jgi:hypothetical protein
MDLARPITIHSSSLTLAQTAVRWEAQDMPPWQVQMTIARPKFV